VIRKRMIVVALAALAAWSLVACSTQNPTTTTTPKTTTKATTTTEAATPSPMAEATATPQGTETGKGYLHGTVKNVDNMTLTLEDVPQYEEVALLVDESAKLVGVEKADELKPGQKVIICYGLGNPSAAATALPETTVSPEVSPMQPAFPTSARVLTLRVVTSFPALMGKVSRVTEEGFDLTLEDGRDVKIILPDRVLLMGIEGKPTMNAQVTVIYDDQDSMNTDDTVTAISVSKA